MLERGIAKNEVVETLKHGEIIEEYKDDFRYPSCLMFKIINGTPLHIIVAHNASENMEIIVTVYIPDSVNFEPDFKIRKNK